MADKYVSAAVYEGGAAVQAFPLGGHASAVAVKATEARSLDAGLASAASVVMLVVPALRTLYVGHRGQVAGKTPDQMRAALFPLPEGVWTFLLPDAAQADLVVIADAQGDLDLRVLAAATVGGEA